MAKKTINIIDKYSNWNIYLVDGMVSGMAKKVKEERLQKVITGCLEVLENPYIRFIYRSDCEDVACFVYDGKERVTKLVPLSDVEQMISQKYFHK